MAMEIKMVVFLSTPSTFIHMKKKKIFDQSHLDTLLSTSTEGMFPNCSSCNEILG